MSDSDSSECDTRANISSCTVNSTFSLKDYEGSTVSNAPTTQLSHLNIALNHSEDGIDSDASRSNQETSIQAQKGSDSTDGHNSRMSSRTSAQDFSMSAEPVAQNINAMDIENLVSILEGGSSSSNSSQPKTTDGQKGSHISVESSSSHRDSEVRHLPSQKSKRLKKASERQLPSTNKQIAKVDIHAIEPHADVLTDYNKSAIKNSSNVDLKHSPKKPRRSIRRVIPPKRYVDEQAQLQQKHRNNTLRNDSDPSDGDDDYKTDEDAPHKPSMLYDRDADVAGQNLFPFRTPKKKNAMASLAASTPKTPQTPSTPKQSRMMNANMLSRTPKTPKTPKSAAANRFGTICKTPKDVRILTKKELLKRSKDISESEGSDFSADDGSEEYQPNDTAEADSIESSESDDEVPYIPPVIKTQKPTVTPHMTRSAARKQQDFIPESDGYFSHHSTKKTSTSDHTLDRLKTPRLPPDQLFGLLATMTLSEAHEQSVAKINQDYQQHFSKWMLMLNEGYNILLNGLGSKRNLMQCFHENMLHHQTVLVVNGFFPSLTIKDILDHISADILEMSLISRNYHEIVDAIDDQLSANREMHIFLIVHNIDGSMLRNNKAQLILSRLASMEQIHLIASLDHINAPLLWDHTMLCNYNFSWWDVTTFLPYSEETAFENSMMVKNSGGLELSAMKNVFLSLNTNSRGIFLIIVDNQIKNKGNSNFQGMPFKDLYSRCREDFLVSSDVALRSQLTEFIDHNLVKMKRTPDGTEHLTIPLEYSLLQQFVEEQENL